MLEGSSLALVVGLAIAVVLLLVGIGLGRRLARRSQGNHDEAMSQSERERMLALLQELGNWTSEYSGNVSDYQTMLGKLSEEVQTGSRHGQAENRVVVLLQQIMQSNEQLQNRLDAAEQQLEKQTQQIQCYLTEARTDGLTGLFNRRAFDQRLEEMFVDYRNGGRSFVVLLIDIDRFKSINDSYGHQAGDQVLQQLAAILRTLLDRSVIVARFGGEEFAAIMDGPLQIAAERMNQVRKQIARERWESDNSHLEVTVSAGLSEPRDDIVVSPVLRRADEALYAAKNTGRDRVYYHDGRGPTLVGAPEIARDTR
jgi:diguanylate cyclase